jgi:hypothetical protein
MTADCPSSAPMPTKYAEWNSAYCVVACRVCLWPQHTLLANFVCDELYACDDHMHILFKILERSGVGWGRTAEFSVEIFSICIVPMSISILFYWTLLGFPGFEICKTPTFWPNLVCHRWTIICSLLKVWLDLQYLWVNRLG